MKRLLCILLALFTAVPAVAGGYTSVLTRPANTTAYATGQLIGSSTTAGSVVVPYFIMPNIADVPTIAKGVLTTNATTGWSGVTVQIDLWHSSLPPTFTNGDGGAYAVATGSANYIGTYSCTLAQAGDGAYGECTPLAGSATFPAGLSGTNTYWTMQIQGSATPISGQTFTFTPEVIY